nr:fatty acid desaturase [Candidatus Poseidoniaceae archaeon]
GLCPIIDHFSPESSPDRSKVSGGGAWNVLLLMHSLFIIATLGVLFWRTSLDGLVLTTVIAAFSTGLVAGASGIINAHEQGHRRKGSPIWWLARLNLLWVQYLHFTTEHNHGHHRNYATKIAPASAPKGRGLWTQIVRTIPLQFRSAWRTHSDKGKTGLTNPILHGLLIQIALVVGLWLGLGQDIAIIFLIQAAFAIILLEYVNYLQHYGLQREVGERHTIMHSWECRKVWSRWTLLELPLHPAHHLKASDPMWKLECHDGSPQLPTGYYGCFWLSVFPPLWRRIMDPRIPEAQNESV